MFRKFRILLSIITGLCYLAGSDCAFSSRKTERPSSEGDESGEESDARAPFSSRGREFSAAPSGVSSIGRTGVGSEGGSSVRSRPKRVNVSMVDTGVTLESQEFWTNQFNFRINGIGINTIVENGMTLEEHSELKSRQLREFYDSYDTTTHLANISVIYTTGPPDAKIGHRHDFPYFFVSGWFVRTFRKFIEDENLAAVPDVARDILTKENFSLGDCYDGLSPKEIRQAESGISFPFITNLIKDFEKRGWKGLRTDNLGSSGQKIAHSEHAFVSCVLRDKLNLPGIQPTAIVIVINGRLHPCDTCELMLKFLIENREFANEFISHLFPATVGHDVSSVSLNVIYTASGKKITTPELDIHGDRPYFVHGRR